MSVTTDSSTEHRVPESSADAHVRVLVHALWSNRARVDLVSRRQRISARARDLDLKRYELIDARAQRPANRVLQWLRGTAEPPHVIELLEIASDAEPDSARWGELLGCERDGFDRTRSFCLVGTPRVRLSSADPGQRMFWFGNGLRELSAQQFAHAYVEQHGALVQERARLIGLAGYTQVANETTGWIEALKNAGLGAGASPAVFAELVMRRPERLLADALQRRRAMKEIAADEKRHIDFSRSMLMLA